MDLAIIVERNKDGSVKTLRSTVQPPSPAMEAAADELDATLHRDIASLERALVTRGMLDGNGTKGSVELWYAVGKALDVIVKKYGISGSRYRRWLWDAVDNLHASDRIKRARRGKTRRHFEYCYRLAQFPEDLAKKMNWSEWVYFFDSPTVRDEPRADEWLSNAIKAQEPIGRQRFRRFAEIMNRRIRRKDTTVLSDPELFEEYQTAWDESGQELTA
jgi:hypothetical protein